MDIVCISPEITPYSRATELGDSCAALAKTLRSLGHRVTVISPLWAGIEPAARSLARKLTPIESRHEGMARSHTVFDGRTTGGVDLVFLGEEQLGAMPNASAANAATRASLARHFAAAAIAVVAGREPRPDVLHVFSWFGACALPLASERLAGLSTVLTLTPSDDPGSIDVREALSHAKRVVVGSQAAHRALLTEAPEAADKISVITEGVDSARWNPVADALLPARFDAVELSGKQRCKAALQLAVGLSVRPEVALVLVAGELGNAEPSPAGRALIEALPAMLHNDVQVVVLGARAVRDALATLAEQYDDRLRLLDEQDERSLHRGLGGADFALLPARSAALGELCLCAQRYGALPIATAEGAAADLLVDCDASLTTGNAFTCDGSPHGLLAASQRALAAHSSQDILDRLRRRVMRTDVSWERAARRYEYLYKQL